MNMYLNVRQATSVVRQLFVLLFIVCLLHATLKINLLLYYVLVHSFIRMYTAALAVALRFILFGAKKHLSGFDFFFTENVRCHMDFVQKLMLFKKHTVVSFGGEKCFLLFFNENKSYFFCKFVK